ncbi:MAG: hypothetical protein C6P35_12950 [Cohnella sp.]|uniref:hypothetical protein n=1 Tax=Cohnella sp. TaxID=1883426 RepID=UPI000E3765A7|nr:hypothetical protein [Cohnella sp.]REK64395.1 MAG: hypothetical protein C6P35_12950 [Cohnella sp.]
MDSGELFTWQALSAMGGASLLTFLIVQYTKEPVSRCLKWLPTDLYAVAIAFLVLLLAQLALDNHYTDWRVYALALANGFLVAAAAGQMQNKALHPPGASGRKNGTVGAEKSAEDTNQA